jgi:hypothetical protein
MKRFGLILGCSLFFQYLMAQSIDMKELTSLLDLSQGKLESHLQKKGFKRNFYEENGDLGICFTREEKGKGKAKLNTRSFQIKGLDGGYQLSYRTTCCEEDSILKNELKSMGFSYARSSDPSLPVVYQKEAITIESCTKKIDTAVYYEITATKKDLPKRKDISGAEDLLQLDAHEYLCEVFGKENVKTDVFYFTETETNKCSVLYPNTNREAIFIWNDEANMKGLSFIVIGGSLKPKEHTNSVNQIAHNAWASRQGVYCGMSLQELVELNQAPIRFYNWQTESAGYLAPNNKGVIDFSRVGVVFNCMNCGFVKLANSQITESESALDGNQKVYVTTLIILPEKKSNEAHAHR